MIATLVNATAIIAGGVVGLLLKKGIKDRYKTTIMQAISLSVILIGIRSALNATDLLGVIVCMAVGSLLGETMKIEDRIEALGAYAEKRFREHASAVGEVLDIYERTRQSGEFAVGDKITIDRLDKDDFPFSGLL